MSNGDSTNPYVGPVPFSTEQKDFFFGRDEEAENLLSLAISERIVLFYAQSGSGKSSLVNARLIPELEERGYEVLPVVRVGGELPSHIPPDRIPNIFVFNALLSLAKPRKGFFGEKFADKRDARALIGKSLTDYLIEKGFTKQSKQHWIIIDQFEEIITNHPSEGLEKRKDFFKHLRQMLEADEMLSLVLVMREDHLAGLDTFAPLLPDRLEARYRIERLKRKAAEEAVRLPALKGGREFEPSAVESLVFDLSQERIADQALTRPGEYVEPLFLQLVCFTLWKSLDEVKSKKTPEADKLITKQDVEKYGNIDEALKKFYSDAVKRVAEKTEINEMAIRRWFGETLVAPTGIRAQVSRGVLNSGGLSNKVVDLLLGGEHLIRLEEARGGKWYELSHDRFIAPIQNSNEEWLTRGGGDSRLARAARLWAKLDRDESFLYRGRLLQNALARYNKNKQAAGPLESEFLDESARVEAKRSTQYALMIAAMAVLLFLAIGFAVFGFYKSSVASAHAQEIEKKSLVENQLRQEALEEQQKLVEANQRLAESERLSEKSKMKDALDQQRKLADDAIRAQKKLQDEVQDLKRRLSLCPGQ